MDIKESFLDVYVFGILLNGNVVKIFDNIVYDSDKEFLVLVLCYNKLVFVDGIY